MINSLVIVVVVVATFILKNCMYPRNMNMIQLIVLLLSGLLLVSVSGDVCIYKECECDGSYIYCNERGLKAIPQKVTTSNTHYDSLYVDVNLITTIPAGSLPSGLKQLSISSNPLTSIDNSAFDDFADTLESLTLSTVSFARLPDAFGHLRNLSKLSFYESNILDWNVDAMKNLGLTLEILYLDNCGMNTWPSWVQYFTHLNQLSVSGNFISSVTDHGLDTLANCLISLDLANNSLTSVPKALSTLSALKWLYLEQNKLTDVTWLPQSNKLASLTLGYNKIFNASQLSQALLPYADSLNYLDIENNLLTSIPNLSFLTQIGSLDYSHNRISDSLSGSVPPNLNMLILESNYLQEIPKVLTTVKSVTEIKLSTNAIKELRAADFPPWTVGADLGFNFISELTDSSFPENCSLRFLLLNNNPIIRISSNAFKNLQGLYELNLQHSKLTRLPLGIADISSLNSVDFTGSTDLVCTCLENGLHPVITSLSADTVLGDCGQTSIFTFYTLLMPDCPIDNDHLLSY